MARTITHTQYEELREYGDHSWRWVNGGPLRSLVTAGYITEARHDRQMFQLTQAGSEALAAYRTRYGIKAVAA